MLLLINGRVVTGEAWFYCATNASNDRKIPLKVDNEGVMMIDRNVLAKTNYLVKLNWQSGNEKFYSEQAIQLK